MSGFWNGLKDFFVMLWGDGWGFYDGMGRYLILLLAGIIVACTVGWILDGRADKRFINSCYARGGHVHYEYRNVAGPVIVVGSVGVPTQSVAVTMKFAPGNEDDCPDCRNDD